MSGAPRPGRLVQIETAFHREATKPGGVDRSGAQRSVRAVLKDQTRAIEKRLDDALVDLVVSLEELSVSLRPSPAADHLLGCSNDVRDLAGLVERHLLTETATCLSDALDAVVYDSQRLDPIESAVFIKALRFAQHDNQRGAPLKGYTELLAQLRDLATHVIARPKAA